LSGWHSVRIDFTPGTGEICPRLTDSELQRLQGLRNALLDLHKALIESERESYEKTGATIKSPNHFLQLLMSDPWFAWLQPLSQLIIAMDEALQEKKPASAAEAEALIRQAGVLLVASEEGTGFASHYHEALQRDPDVVMTHAAAAKYFNARKSGA
jgi:hypothetical protein